MTAQKLSPEDEKRKRAVYLAMSPRGRRFVDKTGYEDWNPFQEPKAPLDLRTDQSKRTTQQLVRLFLQQRDVDRAYASGALECALGIVNREEKYRGIFEFCLWYDELLRKEGHDERAL